MDAALDLIWENSYGTTSVDAICERAGAKKGSFYYFFKSKSELAAAALEAEWNKNKGEHGRSIFRRLFRRSSGSIATLILCTTVWPNFNKSAAIARLPSFKYGRRGEHAGPVVRDTVDRIFDRKIKYFMSAIRDAHAQGLIEAPDPEAKAKICLLVTMAPWRRRASKMTSNCCGTLKKERWTCWVPSRRRCIRMKHLFFCQIYRRLVKYKTH